MNLKLLYIFITTLFLTSQTLFAQWNDSVKVYWLDPVEVTSQKLKLGDFQSPVEKDNLSTLLGRNGFSLIRKGVFFAQDIYADGFKRGDINVVVDGERYHSACPNRMDSPLTRVNPLELESIDLMKTAGSIQCGLGGKVTFNRSTPVEPISLKVGLSGSTAASQSFDGSVMAEGYQQRLSIRYSTGLPYEDGDGREFKDSYGYKENFGYYLAEGSFQGKSSLWKYGASFSYTEDVSFPYLLMDERKNKVFNASLSYDDNKIYFNYTDHLMDNQLRESNMLMVTEANNLTIGAVGDFYELYFRKWNADNVISSPMMTIENKMMPEVNMYSASAHHLIDFGKITISGRVGIVHHSVGDESRLPFYQKLFSDAEGSRWFSTFGLSANYSAIITDDWGAGALVEASSEAPETEYMFIAVQKLLNKPTWSGNPTLNQPLRATMRGSINYKDIRIEAFATQVWNYVNLTKAMVDEQSYLTYENINAYMIGFNFGFSWKFVDMNAGYTFAQNITNDNPLSEIPPLRVTTTVTSPVFYNMVLFLRHSYNDAQTRIDETIKETTTPAWNKVDLGATYSAGSFLIALELNNITNANYYQHLSYLRNPFASGVRVYEPGRTIRLSLRFNSVFN